MAAIPEKIETWQMVQPTTKNKETGEIKPGQLAKTSIPVPSLGPDEVLVKVAGCGVCHTDLGYFFDGVPTVQKPPLTLGHEISGTVVAGDEKWVGKEVIIPAVMPCRKCYLCKTGRGNRCLVQKMPGNSLGVYRRFLKPYSCSLRRPLRGEKSWRRSFGAPGRGGRCRNHTLSGRKKGRPPAGGQCHHHRSHGRGRCLHGSNRKGPGRKGGHRHCQKSAETAASLKLRSGLCDQLSGQGSSRISGMNSARSARRMVLRRAMAGRSLRSPAPREDRRSP